MVYLSLTKEEIKELVNKNNIIARKLSVDYASLNDVQKEELKLQFNNSPCNIWGYIQELESRIKQLEEKGVTTTK